VNFESAVESSAKQQCHNQPLTPLFYLLNKEDIDSLEP